MPGRLCHRRPGRDRHRLLGGVLDVDLEVVLEVLADAGQVVDHVDAEAGEVLLVADAGELEQLRGVDGAAAQDHLARGHAARPAGAEIVDADGALALEPDAGAERERVDGQVLAVPHGVQVGPRGREAAAAVDVAVEAGETLLAVAVDVVGEVVARLLHGLEERAEERVGRRTLLEHERAVAATPLVGGDGAVDEEAGLHPLEVGQAVGVAPLLHARLGGPALVVQRVAALEDHPVDARRAAEHLAARVDHAAAVHVRLGVGAGTSSRRTGCRWGSAAPPACARRGRSASRSGPPRAPARWCRGRRRCGWPARSRPSHHRR